MKGKYKQNAVVIRQEEIANDVYSLWVRADKVAREASAGQFVALYSRDGSRILPRPISICEIDETDSAIHLVYRVAGKGTSEFSKFRSGRHIEVMGPLGNGFPIKDKKAFIIGGGIGIPPMLQLAKQLKCDKQIILGYRDNQIFLADKFRKHGEQFIATEDGSVGTKGNVIDAIRENKLNADIIYACGPAPMLKAIKAYGEENQIETWISIEERMACGVGACLGCVCESKDKDPHSNVNNKRICKDGPVFLAQEVEI